MSELIVKGFNEVHPLLKQVRVQRWPVVNSQVQLSLRVVRRPSHPAVPRRCGIPVMKTHLASLYCVVHPDNAYIAISQYTLQIYMDHLTIHYRYTWIMSNCQRPQDG